MTTKKLTKPQANKLWNELRSHFTNAEKTLIQIIEQRAWEPLGYATFTEAWDDRMQGVPLATDAMRAAVLYAYFDEKIANGETISETEAAAKFKGVGPKTVKALRKQHANGTPAKAATTVVRSHLRGPRQEPHRIVVDMKPEERAELITLLKTVEGDVSPEEWALDVILGELAVLRRRAAKMAA